MDTAMEPGSRVEGSGDCLEVNIMATLLRLAVVIVLLAPALGCSTGWVRLNDIDAMHDVGASLTKAEMTEAIIEGAQDAGWRAKDLGNDTILAVLTVRAHTVQVEIDVGDEFYITRYKSSREMKVFCSQRDRDYLRNMKVTGRQECPGYAAPMYIHSAYKTWVDSLNASIQQAISAAH